MGFKFMLKIRHHQTKTDIYTWRHNYNNVLRVLCNAIIQKVQQSNADNHKSNISGIQFVKEKTSPTTINTEKTQSKRKNFYGYLAGANEWTLPELKAFSMKHFPQDSCQTKKQVDSFVLSQTRKICGWPGTFGSN